MDTLEYLGKRFAVDISKQIVEITDVNRIIMAQVLGELGFKVGAEVGVAEGIHAKVLLDNIPGLRLHLIDAYKHYPGYQEYDGLDKVKEEMIGRMIKSNVVIHQKLSMDAVSYFENDSLDFVYIDGAHDFKNVANDLCEWSKKVRIGGIVFGHDYKQHGPFIDRGHIRHQVDVKDVVRAFCHAKNAYPLFELNNAKRDEIFGRDNPGWLFVRRERNWIW